jgi:hypothetical protein
MALVSPMGLVPLSESYGSLTAGQPATTVTAAGGGDFVAIQGSYLLLRFQTAGTITVITLGSVELSNFGSDVDVTVTMTATQVQYVLIKNDPRFKQTSGNVGYLALTYTSVVTFTWEATYLP